MKFVFEVLFKTNIAKYFTQKNKKNKTKTKSR